MLKNLKSSSFFMMAATVLLGWVLSPAEAATRIEGQVQAGGGAVAGSTVSLWAASAGAPRQLAQTKTGSDGRFELGTEETPGNDVVLYVVAKGGEATVNKGAGDNPAIGMSGGVGWRAAGRGRRQRDDDRGVGLDQRAVPRRRCAQGARARPAESPPATCRTLSISPPAGGARPSWARSTARRRRRWRISPRWPTCLPVAPRGYRPTHATSCSRRRRRRWVGRRPTR